MYIIRIGIFISYHTISTVRTWTLPFPAQHQQPTSNQQHFQRKSIITSTGIFAVLSVLSSLHICSISNIDPRESFA